MPIEFTTVYAAANSTVNQDYLNFAEALVNGKSFLRDGKEASLKIFEGGLSIQSALDASGKQVSKILVGGKEVAPDVVAQALMAEATKVAAAIELLKPEQMPKEGSAFIGSAGLNGDKAHDVKQIALALGTMLGFEQRIGSWTNADGAYNPSADGFTANTAAMQELDGILSQAPVTPAATTGSTAPALKTALKIDNVFKLLGLENPDAVTDPAKKKVAADAAIGAQLADKLPLILASTKSVLDNSPIIDAAQRAFLENPANANTGIELKFYEQIVTRGGLDPAILDAAKAAEKAGTPLTGPQFFKGLIASKKDVLLDAAIKADATLAAAIKTDPALRAKKLEELPDLIALMNTGIIDAGQASAPPANTAAGTQPAATQPAAKPPATGIAAAFGDSPLGKIAGSILGALMNRQPQAQAQNPALATQQNASAQMQYLMTLQQQNPAQFAQIMQTNPALAQEFVRYQQAMAQQPQAQTSLDAQQAQQLLASVASGTTTLAPEQLTQIAQMNRALADQLYALQMQRTTQPGQVQNPLLPNNTGMLTKVQLEALAKTDIKRAQELYAAQGHRFA